MYRDERITGVEIILLWSEPHPCCMEESERGIESWKEHTTAFDRVRSVAEALRQPRPASYIAEGAVASKTATYEHLQRLVEMNVLRTVAGEDATLYEPDPLYARFRTLRRLIDRHDHEELLELKSDLQQQIEIIEQKYDADSPTDLREQASDAEASDETIQLIEDARDWDLCCYRLSVLDEAIDNYSEYSRLDNRGQA